MEKIILIITFGFGLLTGFSQDTTKIDSTYFLNPKRNAVMYEVTNDFNKLRDSVMKNIERHYDPSSDTIIPKYNKKYIKILGDTMDDFDLMFRESWITQDLLRYIALYGRITDKKVFDLAVERYLKFRNKINNQ